MSDIDESTDIAIVVHAYRMPAEKDQRRYARDVASARGRKLGKFIGSEDGKPLTPDSYTVTFHYETRPA